MSSDEGKEFDDDQAFSDDELSNNEPDVDPEADDKEEFDVVDDELYNPGLALVKI
jgi:hypothetical protein